MNVYEQLEMVIDEFGLTIENVEEMNYQQIQNLREAIKEFVEDRVGKLQQYDNLVTILNDYIPELQTYYLALMQLNLLEIRLDSEEDAEDMVPEEEKTLQDLLADWAKTVGSEMKEGSPWGTMMPPEDYIIATCKSTDWRVSRATWLEFLKNFYEGDPLDEAYRRVRIWIAGGSRWYEV